MNPFFNIQVLKLMLYDKNILLVMERKQIYVSMFILYFNWHRLISSWICPGVAMAVIYDTELVCQIWLQFIYRSDISLYVCIYTCIFVCVHGCNIYTCSNMIWVRRDQPVFVLYGWGWVLGVCLYFLFFFLVHKITHSVVNIRTKFTTVLIEHIILFKSIHTTKYNRNIGNKSVQRSGSVTI